MNCGATKSIMVDFKLCSLMITTEYRNLLSGIGVVPVLYSIALFISSQQSWPEKIRKLSYHWYWPCVITLWFLHDTDYWSPFNWGTGTHWLLVTKVINPYWGLLENNKSWNQLLGSQRFSVLKDLGGISLLWYYWSVLESQGHPTINVS